MFELSEHVVRATTTHGQVLLNMKSGSFWQLNRTGALMADALLEGRSEAEIAAILVERYAIEPGTATTDVRVFVRDLVGSGLVLPG